MRYPPEQRSITRRRILDAAGRAFRENGISETGVDEVMHRAGLTHGGFYSHFRNKSDLVAETCASAFVEAAINLDRIAALPTAAARARLLIDSYLSTRHRDSRGSGCVVVGMGADLSRAAGPERERFAGELIRHLDRLARTLRLDPEPTVNRERTLQLLGTLVGTLLLARALGDPAASESMLHSTRRRLKAEYCMMSNRAESGRSVPRRRPYHDFLVAHANFDP